MVDFIASQQHARAVAGITPRGITDRLEAALGLPDQA